MSVDRKQFLHRPSCLLPSLSSLCPRAQLLRALAPALQFWAYIGASLDSPSPRGSRGCWASLSGTSLSPGLPEGQWMSGKQPDLQREGSTPLPARQRPQRSACPYAWCSLLLFPSSRIDCLSPQPRRCQGSVHPSPPPPRQRPHQPRCAGGP